MSIKFTIASNFFNRAVVRLILLVLSWLSGILSGCMIAYHSSADLASLMLALPLSTMSIVGVFLYCSLPLLIAAISFWLNHIFILYTCSFTKAFLFSFTCSCVYLLYSGAGWLAQFLLVFTSSFSSVLYLFMCCRFLMGKQYKWLHICSYALVLLFSLYVDYFMINPFVVQLFNHS